MNSVAPSAIEAADAAVLLARQALYRFSAIVFLDPQAADWERLDSLRHELLVTEAASVIRSLPEAVPARRICRERPLTDLDPVRVLAELPSSREALNRQYEETFGLLVSTVCPPYETEYINSKFTFQRSNALADVSGFYQAFGFGPSVEHPDRPDHIVLELEFMAGVIGLELCAVANGHDERQEICRAAQGRFLKEHLAWWAPAFAALVERESRSDYYTAAARFLAALIPAERALLGVEPQQEPGSPSNVERPDACDGCQLMM